MLLRIKDIPPQGKTINYDLDNNSLNSRIAGDLSKTPEYIFSGQTPVILKVNLQGTTILLDGLVEGEFCTNCSRCAEKVSQRLQTPIHMVLKPTDQRTTKEEDLNFGFYEGEVINCADIAEEMLVLALPMVVRCSPDVNKKCAETKESWVFGEEIPLNNPFKDIKLVH